MRRQLVDAGRQLGVDDRARCELLETPAQLFESSRVGACRDLRAERLDHRADRLERRRVGVARRLAAELLEPLRERLHLRGQDRVAERSRCKCVDGGADVVQRRSLGGQLDATREGVDLLRELPGALLDGRERALDAFGQLVEPPREGGDAVLDDLDAVEHPFRAALLG